MAKLLLVSVRAWEPVDENKLRSLYETGQWTDLQHFTEPGSALVKSFLHYWTICVCDACT